MHFHVTKDDIEHKKWKYEKSNVYEIMPITAWLASHFLSVCPETRDANRNPGPSRMFEIVQKHDVR